MTTNFMEQIVSTGREQEYVDFLAEASKPEVCNMFIFEVEHEGVIYTLGQFSDSESEWYAAGQAEVNFCYEVLKQSFTKVNPDWNVREVYRGKSSGHKGNRSDLVVIEKYAK